MENLIVFKLGLIAFLFLLSGIFSCSEAALFSLTPLHLHKMAQERTPFLRSVQGLLGDRRRLLVTIIFSNESVNIAVSVLAASIFVSLLGVEKGWLSIAVTTPLLLIFCEAVPKTLGMTDPIRFSSLLSPLLYLVSGIVRPFAWLLEAVSRGFVVRFAGRESTRRSVLTEDEFKHLIDAGRQEGALEETQRALIHGVFEMEDRPVSELMVPRVDVFCLPTSMHIEEMKREVIRARHSRIPIYGRDRDDIRGLLLAADLLKIPEGVEKAFSIESYLRKVYFVPEFKTAGRLLREFQERRLQTAVVVDEYGGVSGLITLEDILEHLFRDIYDEHGIRKNLWEKVGENVWVVSGRMETEDLNELLGLSLSPEEFETTGGFVLHLFGKLPQRGEAVSFGGYRFLVVKVGPARILSIWVTRETQDGAEDHVV
ncbi:MAG: HlyC/CorC family transporter [Syntrophaceae bacterium]|nr:HlyC/CorC family transporter [Syntrophaceae bacterium]